MSGLAEASVSLCVQLRLQTDCGEFVATDFLTQSLRIQIRRASWTLQSIRICPPQNTSRNEMRTEDVCTPAPSLSVAAFVAMRRVSVVSTFYAVVVKSVSYEHGALQSSAAVHSRWFD
ncbi:hypothetical protein Mapa_017456 [Marchantia paleacea]|nr:hypothetical protein Mapa_017456 [Marchantia paleacea]